MKNKQAFTLIELLVVVLIIGILAAVAVPQYQKAVEKSRRAEALIVLNNIYKAYQLCRLSNPQETCISLPELDIIVPGSYADDCVNNDCYHTKYWEYGTNEEDTVYATRILDFSKLGDVNSRPYELKLKPEESATVTCSSGACVDVCGAVGCKVQ